MIFDYPQKKYCVEATFCRDLFLIRWVQEAYDFAALGRICSPCSQSQSRNNSKSMTYFYLCFPLIMKL